MGRGAKAAASSFAGQVVHLDIGSWRTKQHLIFCGVWRQQFGRRSPLSFRTFFGCAVLQVELTKELGNGVANATAIVTKRRANKSSWGIGDAGHIPRTPQSAPPN
jgi:hypothetical protein